MSAYQQALAALRIIPPGVGGRRASRLFERNFIVYRTRWLMLVSGFLEPLFYLLSIGIGLGAIVGSVPGPGGEAIPYQLFVAPALLAQSTSNGAITDATFNVFFKLRYEKTYDSILATPLSVGDIALGEIGWALFRGALYAAGFAGAVLVLGLVRSPWFVLVLPASFLIGFAFAAVGMAATTWMRSWQDLDLVQLVLLPLFLFSGTFFPLETYPEGLRIVVQLTPLWHAVDLLRSLALGAIGPHVVVHVLYLTTMGLLGLAVVARRLDRLLLK
ncbi:MAG TPA: ABC transporter permease [Candidatus Limnocylindrales bacterium]|nr:ABC transporter permease [Candidatus Limnocylindrales bacterium]